MLVALVLQTLVLVVSTVSMLRILALEFMASMVLA